MCFVQFVVNPKEIMKFKLAHATASILPVLGMDGYLSCSFSVGTLSLMEKGTENPISLQGNVSLLFVLLVFANAHDLGL